MPSLYRILIDPQCDTLHFDIPEHKEVLTPLDGAYKLKRLPKTCLPVHFGRRSESLDKNKVLSTEIGGLVLRDEILASNERLYYSSLGIEGICLRYDREFFILFNPTFIHGIIDMRIRKVPHLFFRIRNQPLEHLFCFDGLSDSDYNFVFLSKEIGITGILFELVRTWQPDEPIDFSEPR